MNPPQALIDNRSDPDAREVLRDWMLERNMREERLGVMLQAADAAAAAAAADADDADDAAAAAADDADADDADDAADADADARTTNLLTEEPDMRNGLKVIQLPGSGYWVPTFVGWLRRVSGDEWELCAGYRVINRTQGVTQGGLDRIAEGPPKKGYQFGEPSGVPQEVHRLLVRSSRPANAEAYAVLVPRPRDWVE